MEEIQVDVESGMEYLDLFGRRVVPAECLGQTVDSGKCRLSPSTSWTAVKGQGEEERHTRMCEEKLREHTFKYRAVPLRTETPPNTVTLIVPYDARVDSVDTLRDMLVYFSTMKPMVSRAVVQYLDPTTAPLPEMVVGDDFFVHVNPSPVENGNNRFNPSSKVLTRGVLAVGFGLQVTRADVQLMVSVFEEFEEERVVAFDTDRMRSDLAVYPTLQVEEYSCGGSANVNVRERVEGDVCLADAAVEAMVGGREETVFVVSADPIVDFGGQPYVPCDEEERAEVAKLAEKAAGKEGKKVMVRASGSYDGDEISLKVVDYDRKFARKKVVLGEGGFDASAGESKRFVINRAETA